MKISRILVPTDFSADAEAALGYALDLAVSHGGSVELLHVVENPMAAGVWSADMYTAAVEGLHVNLVRDARRRLRAWVPRIAGMRMGIAREVCVGRPAEEIVKRAAEEGVDLIVMGTAGRTGLSRLAVGSVAERVVRTADCPVLTVRAGAREGRRQHHAVAVASHRR